MSCLFYDLIYFTVLSHGYSKQYLLPFMHACLEKDGEGDRNGREETREEATASEDLSIHSSNQMSAETMKVCIF